MVYDGEGDAHVNNIDIVDLGNPPDNRFLRMLFGTFKVLCSDHLDRAEVVHIHDPELLVAGLLLKLRGKKVIYDAHEDLPRQIATKSWVLPSLRRVLAALVEGTENFLARRLDAVVAATPLIAERFRKVNPRTVVVRNFPLLGEFLQIPLEKPVSRDICYIGGLTRERGIIELLDALSILGSVRLIACGPFESAAFEAELRGHAGWKHVEYLGVVGRKEVANVLARAQIGLVTLLSSPNQIEALPVKMFEYMASGTPFLASNFPLWLAIAKDTGGGRCVDPASPKSIADALTAMLSQTHLLREMGAAGRSAAVDHYNWTSEETTLLKLYKDLFPLAVIGAAQ